MRYTRGFFDTQLRFGARVAVVADIPLEDALCDRTILYVAFGSRWLPDPDEPRICPQ